MSSSLRLAGSVALAFSVSLALESADARADEGGVDSSAPDTADTPCGNFDFSGGATCKIEVAGGCSAHCTPLSFEAACTGGCSATADTTCADSCGTLCIQSCNPASLDCFAGCHAECDQPTTAECQQKHAADDCAAAARAQCDVHCNDSCKVPPTTCQEHCTECCHGSCMTQINFDCDFACFAQVEGGCSVACQRPEGAIFCNDQYVYASDVEACIVYLAKQGISVDVSARASVTCDLNGCQGAASAIHGGCSAAPRSRPGVGELVLGGVWLALLGLAAGLRRRRRT